MEVVSDMMDLNSFRHLVNARAYGRRTGFRPQVTCFEVKGPSAKGLKRPYTGGSLAALGLSYARKVRASPHGGATLLTNRVSGEALLFHSLEG